jgi:hypothetical protein
MATQHMSRGDVLVLIALLFYAPLAFGPFIVFVYPKLKTPRKSVSIVASVIEVLLVVMFIWIAMKCMPMPPSAGADCAFSSAFASV